MQDVLLFTVSGAAVVGIAVVAVSLFLLVPLALLHKDKSLAVAFIVLVLSLITFYFIGRHLWTTQPVPALLVV